MRVVLKNKSGTTEVVKKENAKASDVLGADLMTLDNDACKKLGIKGGVKVTNLNSAGKLARYTDMQDGFVITKIGDTPVNKVEDVERLLSGRSGGVLLEGVYPGYPNTYYYGFGM